MCAEAGSSPGQPLVMSYRALISLSGSHQCPKVGVCLTSKQVEGAAKYQLYRGAVFAEGCKQTAKWVDFSLRLLMSSPAAGVKMK